ELDGSLLGANSDGLVINGADNVQVRGLSVHSFSRYGIHVQNGADDFLLQSSHIGTDAAGLVDLGNGSSGIYISNSARATIGVTDDGLGDSGEFNVISGNANDGITVLSGNQVRVAGNLIGVDVTGVTSLLNGNNGVYVYQSDSPIVGTDGDGNSDALERNVIGGASTGIHLWGWLTDGAVVAGNYVGVDATGNAAIAGSNGTAVFLWSTQNVRIGTDADGTSDELERNVLAAGVSHGVQIGQWAGGTTLSGNYIGIGADGNTQLPIGTIGVLIYRDSYGTLVGGTSATERNIISSSGGWSVIAAGNDNIIQGNYVGLNATGTAVLPTMGGILVSGSYDGYLVGGTDPGAANYIAGTTWGGITADGGAMTNLRIQGNSVGVGPNGDVFGGGGAGIRLNNVTGGGLIGGTVSEAGNIIRGMDSGIVLNGDPGTEPNQVSILGNSIFDNAGLGIDLADDDVTYNDMSDADTGVNGLLNHPEIISQVFSDGHVTVIYDLDVPAGDYRIEFFDNDAADASGFGEGQTFRTAQTITASGSETQRFSATFAGVAGDIITATATVDLGGGSYGSTSEFSALMATGNVVSGRVFEDIDGNLLAGGEVIGDVNNPGIAGATVLLYLDGGDGIADGADDFLVGSTTTDASGDYAFNVTDATYYVVVDSRTIVSGTTLNAGHTTGETWAEQT
ncbi:MAG: hypothetical protein KDA59_23950, partial [Planctomycetales bacterium]|nr:hypothetical protein [Planctomycetales bacterium]